jgi:hypothetical protein
VRVDYFDGCGAVHLIFGVDADVIEWAGHDRDRGVAGFGAVTARTTQAATLDQRDHSNYQPDDDYH